MFGLSKNDLLIKSQQYFQEGIEKEDLDFLIQIYLGKPACGVQDCIHIHQQHEQGHNWTHSTWVKEKEIKRVMWKGGKWESQSVLQYFRNNFIKILDCIIEVFLLR